MESNMVQSRAIPQIKVFKIGCRVPCPWEGPFPRHYSPQQKMEFMIGMLPLLEKWTKGIEAYEKSVKQPCKW
ncbi:hypothetical protein KI387_033076, partial [Taxus chinensis]